MSNTVIGLSLFAYRIDEELCNILQSYIHQALDDIDQGLSERLRLECELVTMLLYYWMTFMNRDHINFLEFKNLFYPFSNQKSKAVDDDMNKFPNVSDSSIHQNYNQLQSYFTPGMNTFSLCFDYNHNTSSDQEIHMSNKLDIPNNTLLSNDNSTDGNTSNRMIHRFFSSKSFIKQYRHLIIISFFIISKYIFQRIQKYSLLYNWRVESETSIKYKLYKYMKIFDNISKFFGVANILLYINNGNYPSCLYRAAGISMISQATKKGVYTF